MAVFVGFHESCACLLRAKLQIKFPYVDIYYQGFDTSAYTLLDFVHLLLIALPCWCKWGVMVLELWSQVLSFHGRSLHLRPQP